MYNSQQPPTIFFRFYTGKKKKENQPLTKQKASETAESSTVTQQMKGTYSNTK
jgi:hypothetical protein